MAIAVCCVYECGCVCEWLFGCVCVCVCACGSVLRWCQRYEFVCVAVWLGVRVYTYYVMNESPFRRCCLIRSKAHKCVSSRQGVMYFRTD